MNEVVPAVVVVSVLPSTRSNSAVGQGLADSVSMVLSDLHKAKEIIDPF